MKTREQDELFYLRRVLQSASDFVRAQNDGEFAHYCGGLSQLNEILDQNVAEAMRFYDENQVD